MKFSLLMIGLFLLTLYGACQKNPVSSEDRGPGSRAYTWTVDTLDMPMNDVRCVWGAAPNDVWAVGPGGTRWDRLWHYDGTAWSAYQEELMWCTGATLYGFASDNVWMGGGGGWLSDGAAIWHYDGDQWEESYVYTVEGAYDIVVNDIWGTRPTNMYACGVVGYFDGEVSSFRGFILHYNGRTWEEVLRATWDSQFVQIRQDRQGVYVLSFSKPDTTSFYVLREKTLHKLYSLSDRVEEGGSLSVINQEVYFTIAKTIYQYQDGTFQQQFTIQHPEYGYQIFGRHAQDIFVRMQDGLAHYNGTDLQYLYTFPPESRASISPSPVLFRNEVFFPVWAPGLHRSNMILHGTLTK
jgi:hypothetical protein